jgi:type IV fimbrial biogenesis protein FimT
MNLKTISRRTALLRSAGFTLVELLMVVAIGAALVAVAAPTFKGTVSKYRLGGESSSLLDSLLLARNEARVSTSTVSICSSTDGLTCTNSNWHTGYIVFRDANANGQVDGTEEVLTRTIAAKPGITIATTLQQTGAPFGRRYLQFGPDGKMDIRTAILFTACTPGQQGLLTAVQYNGSTSTYKSAGACP